MNTNQFWNAENIKAVASLWPLALIVLLTLVGIAILIFFLPQTRNFISGLKNLKIKFWTTELALNQPINTPLKPEVETNVKEAATSAPQIEKKEDEQANADNQPELDLNSDHGLYFYLVTGKLEEAEKVFQKLQSTTTDPEVRIRREAFYLQERFEKGDTSAQTKLHQLEIRGEEVKSGWLGYIKRMDALCYEFSRDYEKAVDKFKDSAASCATDGGRARSLGMAAKSLYKFNRKEEAFRLLKEAFSIIQDSDAKISLLDVLADLYKKENDNFNHALTLQLALSFQPNSKDLLFKTAYACAEAELTELAVLHYETLVQIDSTHNSALNNLGVAFDKLKIRSLAIKNYKRAIDIDETLSAANFANVLIGIGALDEAEKLLSEAKTKKEVHPNVMTALVSLDEAKEDAKESRTKSLNLASAQYQYLLEFAGAMLFANQTQFPLGGKWKNANGEVISIKAESTNGIELVWSESNNEKFRFKGNTMGLASKGKVEQWKEPSGISLLLLTGKPEGKFEAYGSGYVFLSKNLNLITIFIQNSDSHRSILFNKAGE